MSEQFEIANVLASLDQTFSFTGLVSCAGTVLGSGAIDSFQPYTVSQIVGASVIVNTNLSCP